MDRSLLVLVRQRWGAGRRCQPTALASLGTLVVVWWLAIAGAVAQLLPPPAASSPIQAAVPVVGRTAHIHQPGMPGWPIPVDRPAFDEHQRGFRESDEEAVERAFTMAAWIDVRDGQHVLIAAVDGEAVQVQLLDGPSAGQQGWLTARHLRP